MTPHARQLDRDPPVGSDNMTGKETLPEGWPLLKVIITDDHAVVRRGVRQILEEIPDVVGEIDEAAGGRPLMEKIKAREYDLVLLDISMPDLNGIDALKQIKSIRPKTKVLILSIYPEDQFALRALKAGASGYLTKEGAAAELVAAVRKIASGGRYVSSGLAEKLVTSLDRDVEKSAHETLSDREYQILRMIAKGGKISDIADGLFLGVRTISTYRARILQKMGLKTTADIVRYALENNLLD